MNKIEYIIAQEGFEILEKIIIDLANKFLHHADKDEVINKVNNVKSKIKLNDK